MLAYLLVSGSLLALYGFGGFSKWWRGLPDVHLDGGGSGGRSGGGWGGGGGFRGGK
jgi:hypothetical protein